MRLSNFEKSISDESVLLLAIANYPARRSKLSAY
jgi:hypothetical protein